jgi:membrane protease YdiL (CAAX protease family)
LASPAVQTVRKRPVAIEVIAFIVVAFAVTWASGSLILLSNHADLVGGGSGSPRLFLPIWVAGALLLVADLGPTVGALVVLAVSDGGPGVRRWLGQLKRWRVGWYWYAIALVGPTAISLVAVGAFVAAGGQMAPAWIVLQPGRIALTAVGGWAEELGWRGFAQPTLQSRVGAAAAAVAVGVMWSVWHQWQLAAPGGAAFMWSDAGWSLLYLVSVSVLMAWIYNSTRASLPSAIAGHVGINAVRFNPYPVGLVAVAFGVAALIVTVITGPKSLVRRGAAPPHPLLPDSASD